MKGPAASVIPDELLDRVRDGDADAFRVLVRRIHPLVYRWAVVRTADPDLAEDVAQEVMVRVHSGIAEFRRDARFTTWLYRLTANAATDQRRAAGRRTRLADRLLATAGVASPSTRAAGPNSSASEPDRTLIRRVLKRFAGELPDRQRALFDLVDLQGFEPTEAADMLGISQSTARVHLHRARRALRSALVERAPEITEEYGGTR